MRYRENFPEAAASFSWAASLLAFPGLATKQFRTTSIEVPPWTIFRRRAVSSFSDTTKQSAESDCRERAISMQKMSRSFCRHEPTQWHRLQPVGVRACRDKTPQAKGCAT